METNVTAALEKFVVELIIDRAFELGFVISVNDGEETTLIRSKDKAEIIGAMFTTDADYLYFYNPIHGNTGSRLGWAYLVYGNSGYDVISDYADNPTTEDILSTANSVYDAYHDGKLKISFSL